MALLKLKIPLEIVEQNGDKNYSSELLIHHMLIWLKNYSSIKSPTKLKYVEKLIKSLL